MKPAGQIVQSVDAEEVTLSEYFPMLHIFGTAYPNSQKLKGPHSDIAVDVH